MNDGVAARCTGRVERAVARVLVLFLSAVLVLAFALLAGCTPNSELTWNSAEGYRWAEVEQGYFGRTGFELLSPSRTNIHFRNDVRRELIQQNRHYLNGSGVAAGDVDGDGLVDLYFARLDGPNKLYRNLGGFRFEDVTERAGVADASFNSTGVSFADVNGNGHLDLLVTSLSGRNMLYVNDGSGNFAPESNSGLGESNGAMTMALADVNGDGHLDVYITNYKTRTVRDIFGPAELSLENTVEVIDGEMKVITPFDAYYTIVETEERPYRNEYGQADELYLNTGNGGFEKVDDMQVFHDANGRPTGLSRDWGLTAAFHDVNGDMLPDLYVANDFWTPDRMWINQGDGTFRAIGMAAIRNMSFASMGVDFSDIDRDGSVDFVVTEMLSDDHTMRMRQYSEHLEEYEGRPQYNRNSLYLNRGDTTFSQIAYFSGLESTDWSWATRFLDVDLDGYEDLIVATGFAYDYQDMDTQIALDAQDRGAIQEGGVLEYPPLKLNNKILRNNQDLTFADTSTEWGFDVDDLSFGMALADLNNDGAPDLVINRMDDEAAIYENRSSAPRIAVRLNGARPNTQGIGARIELHGGPVPQSKEMTSGGGYLSGSQAQVVFAADDENVDHVITVTWPGGRQSRISGVQSNRVYIIDETGSSDAPAVSRSRPISTKTLFEDASDRIDHRHLESEYDDFRYEPLLPIKLSRLGPGMAWIDMDGNGLDDLFITAGKGDRPALYENLGNGQFQPREADPLTGSAPGDQTAVVGWAENGTTKVVVGSANYEQGDPGAPSAYIYSIDRNGQVAIDSLPGVLSTTGPIAAADYSGDGLVDLFVGGRFVPGQYPRDAQSRLFTNQSGSFQLDDVNSRLFSDAGLVTGALFSDFDQDGDQDLLISSAWGTLRLFENNRGAFAEITERAGLEVYKGWWSGVATGDFNNDGLPDIIATNLGTNSPYKATTARPWKMYYDDLTRDGRLNIVEAYYDEYVEAYVPSRQLLDFESIPTVFRKVRSHVEFANGTVGELFGIDLVATPSREINTLEHMIFINTGDGFTGRPLPSEAQFTAAFHAGVGDFNNDGNDDLFLSQNFFALPIRTPRLDAGRGLLMIGDGRGNLTPISGNRSGIKVYGEQRGAALSDFDGDGRVDLVVSQNNGRTKLYRNRTDEAGIRVKLIGRGQNTDAIGSSIRIAYENGNRGPRREIQAGSGYLSQGSATQVIGTGPDAAEIEIVWYDGATEFVPILSGKEEYRIVY